jgi:hypothetical protein
MQENERPGDSPDPRATSGKLIAISESRAEIAELAIRNLLRPNAIRLTVEPIIRLRDDAIMAYEVRWRIPRLDVIPSTEM